MWLLKSECGESIQYQIRHNDESISNPSATPAYCCTFQHLSRPFHPPPPSPLLVLFIFNDQHQSLEDLDLCREEYIQ